MTTAFVLGGARNLGATQVGMLQALAEARIVPDLVLGCSVGALNGAAIAKDPTPQGVRRLERLWRELARRDLGLAGPVRAALGLLRRGQAVGRDQALRRVVEAAAPATFAELAVPFACVAASLSTGRERWFDTGPLADAILASAALPGLLPPVEIDGEPYVDGAAVNVVPLAKAIELGATRLFVLQIKDLDAEPIAMRRPLDVVLRAYAISRNARFLQELDAVPPAVAVHLLPVVGWPRLRYDGFSRTAELVDRARGASAAYLAERGLAQ